MKQSRQVFILYRLRHFATLAGRALASVRSRGLPATARLVIERISPTRRQPYTLELYRDIGERPEVRDVPDVAPGQPVRASVIIPVHDQVHYTLRCLHALANSGDTCSFEVIVVDDASNDDTAALLPRVTGLRYHRNASNLGFIDSCNAGAAIARGEFLVFLNNDTLVQPGWLDALLSTFDSHPDTGLAGSKLVYPDGSLQEAGGIVFADGSAANHGRNGDASDPRYNFVREADYCSGAALALRKELFDSLGGFDIHYRPAYYEDTDLAMRVRQRSLKVRYQPASVVVHFEGASSGTDINTGVKAYQVVNRGKFLARWAQVLAASHPQRAEYEGDIGKWLVARHRARARLLVIDSYTPTPDRDSGSVRMFELLRLLEGSACAVSFFGQSQTWDGAYSSALQQAGIEVWWRPWLRSLLSWMKVHGPHFDAIIVSRHYVLSPMMPLLRKLAPNAQVVFDTVDLHFLREQREAESLGAAAAATSAGRTRNIELALVREVDRTWVVSDAERTLLAGLVPAARVDIVSNIHVTVEDTPGFATRSDLVFVGGFRHPPNVDAVLWFAQEILPRVRLALPEVTLHVIGADAPQSILDLRGQAGLNLLGHVPDLDGLLDGSRVGLAPLRFGAGIKGKVNQGLARGLPMVATTCAIEGMFLRDGESVMCADSASDFADAIVRLYQDQATWQRLRAAGFENTRQHFSRDSARAVIEPWIAWLGASKASRISAADRARDAGAMP